MSAEAIEFSAEVSPVIVEMRAVNRALDARAGEVTEAMRGMLREYGQLMRRWRDGLDTEELKRGLIRVGAERLKVQFALRDYEAQDARVNRAPAAQAYRSEMILGLHRAGDHTMDEEGEGE